MFGTASAVQLSPDQALARLGTHASRVPAHEMTLAYTASNGLTNQFYIFNEGVDEGFAIVAADDCISPLIGYADNGSFNLDKIPDNMRAWLNGYQRQIEAAIVSDEIQSRAVTFRNAIAPLVTTRWDQDAPYNNNCPMDGDKRSVTGCVATAMAQVMKYHNWPPKGNGSNTYNWTNSAGQQTSLTMDFSSITFDWENMTDTYSSSSSAAQNSAVATLMAACGYSVDMIYSGTESGAMSQMIPYALAKYFDYDGSIQYLLRDYYGIEEWEDMIYAELAAGRPLIYDGSTASKAGHEFVCDGYENGYFHINWGWGGISDGYFRLTLLSPGIQGIGGADSGFNFNQGAVIGIRKKASGAAVSLPAPYVTADEFTIDDALFKEAGTKSFRKTESINFGSRFFNMSVTPINMNFGLKLVNTATNAVRHIKCVYSDEQMMEYQFSMGGLRSFPVSGTQFPTSGTFAITPAYYNLTDGKWYDILVPISNPKLTVVCDTKNVTVSMESASVIKALNLAFLSPLVAKSAYKISADIDVTGKEYHGIIVARLYSPGTNQSIANDTLGIVDFLPDERTAYEAIGNFEQLNISTETEYEFVLADNSGKTISDRIKVKVSPAVTETVYTVTDISFPGAQIIDNIATTPCDKITISATVTCSKGYMTSPVEAYLFPYLPGQQVSAVSRFSSEPLFIMEGNSTQATLAGSYYEPGEYIVSFRIGNSWSENKRITLTDAAAGVNDVAAESIGISTDAATDFVTVTSPETITLVEIYSLNGTRMAAVNPDNTEAAVSISGFPTGLYIVRATANSGITTKRIIKR